jgi:hypothetical protein
VFTKKACVASILIICLIVATPISVLSGVDDDVQQVDQMEGDLMNSSGLDDSNTLNLIGESGNGANEMTNNTNEPDDNINIPTGNSNEPSGGTDESTNGTDEPIDGTGEPDGGTDGLTGGADELNDDINNTNDTVESNDESNDETDEETGELDDEADEPSVKEMLLLAMPREDVPIRVETYAQLINVFNYGAAIDTDGDFFWSGERIVEIAFDHFTGTITPNTGTERTITLKTDGSSRNVTIGGTDRHFNIGDKVTLIIDDENLHFVGRDLDNVTGGGISVTDGGTLKLFNGTIRNSCASFGGGVLLNGASALFEMHGGVIEKNRATDSGGGICVNGESTFYMYDGVIRENRIPIAGNSGGGVRVMGSSVFNMQGGLIEGNEVLHMGQFAYGGGVLIGEVDQSWLTSTFNMNGGIIRNNKAQWGGGVAAYNGFFNLGTGRTERGAAPIARAGTYIIRSFRVMKLMAIQMVGVSFL